MVRHFEVGLAQLKADLISMAGLVESAIENALFALQKRDPRPIAQLFNIEKRVNEAHKAIDESCMNLLALQQPLAIDLRLIVAIIKINADLERMGDQAVNIAHNLQRYLKSDPLKPLVDLPEIAQEVRFMVREAIDAFVKSNELLARDVLKRDDRVDALKNKIFRDALAEMKASPELIEQGLNLILIARNLERIGDHATNIAEDVIFVISGEDIRHSSRFESSRNVVP